MQVQLREQWNVEQHHRPQEVQVREGKVVRVGHFDAPLFRVGHVRLGPEEAQQLTGHAGRVQHYEGGVAQKDEQLRDGVDQVEGVVRVSNDLRHRPGQYGKRKTR